MSTSTMSIRDIITIGLTAFLAAVGLVVQWVSSHRSLKMDSTYLHVLEVSKDTSVFLLCLSFVNNASIGRVVYDILPKDIPENINLGKARYRLDLDHQNVVYQLPTLPDVTLPISEVLLPPLHIPPHQSLNIWYGMEMKVNPTVSHVLEPSDSDSSSEIGILTSQENPVDYENLQNLKQEIYLKAINFDKKEICSYKKEILPFQKQSVPTFEKPPLRNRFISLPDFVNDPSFMYFLMFIILLILVFSLLSKRS